MMSLFCDATLDQKPFKIEKNAGNEAFCIQDGGNVGVERQIQKPNSMLKAISK